MSIQNIDKEYVANTYGRYPITLTEGKGAVMYDETGKKYIDLGSGIAVNTFGAADAEWLAAVTKQAGQLQHTSNYYYTEPCALLAEQLCKRTGMKKVFFGNSGAEANECAIKTARRWAYLKYGDESHATIITLKNSFHGRTITTLSATGQDVFHEEFGPFTPGFVYAAADDPEEVRQYAAQGNCCAVMMETIQGEGGVLPLSEEYVAAVCEIAKEYDLLVIVDEVQTGNGRTGDLYAFMHYEGFMPDIATTAKGLAGGLPLGACMLGEKVKDVLGPGKHGSTFGGNPVACAGALSIVNRLTDELLAEVRAKGEYIRNTLEGAKNVQGMTGRGLMVGIAVDKDAHAVAEECLARGVLVLTAKDKVRLLPPLNIGMDELREAVAVLKEVIEA
ncbi:MAG: acetylornithine/succinylornithine family transaminase [Eubacteriales bacterium]|nr:acetylornithine/succinylornithine family transaminase [Eubacteriales bacterium]